MGYRRGGSGGSEGEGRPARSGVSTLSRLEAGKKVSRSMHVHVGGIYASTRA